MKFQYKCIPLFLTYCAVLLCSLETFPEVSLNMVVVVEVMLGKIIKIHLFNCNK